MTSVSDEAAGDDAAFTETAGAGVAALVDPAVAGITRLSALETVRARIALAIELGLLARGDRLPTYHQVADALGVSDITARRALESLADDGLLARRRGRAGGTFVAERTAASTVDAVGAYLGDAATVHELIDRRTLLECAVVHHAALVIGDDELAELDRHVERAARAGDWSEYHSADEALHLAIARASGLAWALPHYSATLYALYEYFLPYPVAYLHRVNADHAEVVDALRRHDPVAAVAIMEAHVQALHRSMFVGLSAPRGDGSPTPLAPDAH